jgi:hypothetical protein
MTDEFYYVVMLGTTVTLILGVAVVSTVVRFMR